MHGPPRQPDLGKGTGALTPIETSLDVPKSQYMSTPINEEYRPYWTSRVVNFAYAIPCGTTMAPMVTPGTPSLVAEVEVPGPQADSSIRTHLPRYLRRAIAYCNDQSMKGRGKETAGSAERRGP